MLKSKKLFKAGSILCMILFYLTALVGIFIVGEHVAHLWFQDSSFTTFLGPFEPIFSYADLYFYEEPELYSSTSFLALSFASGILSIGTALLFLWYLSKFLKNLNKDGLFMKENVPILYKLGMVNLILGTAFVYLDGYLLKQALQELEIVNADMVFTDFSYWDSLISGFILILFASALKSAVHAVEENKNTI
ncbi:DUF2975 domain-containing protein [Paenibacillus sp. Marseille-Q4541]|uniref:DUF2975 domain-containing protein n=1 Tax=Paenibacillus sp. Marseille-Q4541 TaxID=2831522 RepID=UPI001BA853B2|nr:DUF2975 domain-containing protein [Paenibacillus sp. Marseille-Q4541]